MGDKHQRSCYVDKVAQRYLKYILMFNKSPPLFFFRVQFIFQTFRLEKMLVKFVFTFQKIRLVGICIYNWLPGEHDINLQQTSLLGLLCLTKPLGQSAPEKLLKRKTK